MQSAFEINNNQLVYGQVVLLVLAGSIKGLPIYLFERLEPNRKPLRVHTHMGDARGQGGYDFMTYHPATALPQQDWAT